jgi:outer membrane receptor protein involved in Fe transport
MRLNRFLIIVVSCLLVGLPAFGQTTGSLSGTVTSSGARLPGVTVSITSPNLAGSRTAVTDSTGNYNFTDLAPGDFTVTFELQGLQVVTAHVTVVAGQTAHMNADLQVRKAAIAEELTVTGSLIPRPSIEAMSPVATLDVQEIQYQGTTRLESFLQNLPQVFAAQNSTYSNGASGTASIDLRHLGESRTLVLVDGKRLPPGGNSSAPDLNFIPAGLVKRVDILTGGASAVYGADAVAGVVNFILDEDFEGVKAGVSGGLYNHKNDNLIAQSINKARGFSVPTGSAWDGQQVDSYVAFGGKFGDNGHGTVYLDYRKTQALLKNRRDYTNCAVSGLPSVTVKNNCSGSSTIPLGRFLTDSGDFTLDTSGPGNTFRNFSSATDLFNFAPYNYMQRPDTRWGGGGFLNYNFNKHANAYASVMLMDDRTDAQIAPSGDFFVTDSINCDNPMLSADQRKKICTDNGYGLHDIAGLFIGRRNVEGAGRVDHLSHQAFRLLGGLKGDINNVWSYDLSGLHAETRVPEEYSNDLDSRRLQDALIVDGDPNDPSTWHCRSGNAGCVPWNVFKIGGVTQDALAYLQIPLISNLDAKTQVASLTLRGDLKKYGLALPTAAQGLSLAFGTDYNKYSLDFRSDQAYQLGVGAGQGGPVLPVSGEYHVKEYFGEVLVPIIQGARGARDLSVELGYRSSDYSTSGRFPTYKVQVAYAPSTSLKFRGGYNKAVRSPNIFELFTPQGLGLGGSEDPCAGDKPAFTLEQCQRTGVTPAQYGKILESPAQQYNTLDGGNAKLTPEKADTRTFGIVITPAAWPTFSAAFDYYNIKLKDTIGVLAADQVISQCAVTGDPSLCNLIHRDRLGTLWLTQQGYTVETNLNIGRSQAEGIDVNLDYLRPVGTSSLSFTLIGNYLKKYALATPLYAYDCKGYFGDQCGQPNSKWRHYSRLGFQRGSTGVTLGWRMIGSATVDAANPSPAIAAPNLIARYQAAGSYHYGNFNYLDLAATYNMGSNVHWTIGVNNIADKEPPLGQGFSFNDFSTGFGAYDPYGRYVHASILFTYK